MFYPHICRFQFIDYADYSHLLNSQKPCFVGFISHYNIVHTFIVIILNQPTFLLEWQRPLSFCFGRVLLTTVNIKVSISNTSLTGAELSRVLDSLSVGVAETMGRELYTGDVLPQTGHHEAENVSKKKVSDLFTYQFLSIWRPMISMQDISKMDIFFLFHSKPKFVSI